MVYNKDVFIEELIRRKRPGGETLFKVGAVILGLILVALAFHFFTSIFPFFFAVIVILEFFLFIYTVKEYEYSFINGDLDIDTILGKRKRKNVLSCAAREIRLMEPVTGKVEGEFTQVLDASVSPRAPGRWYFICERDDGSRILVYLSPSDRLLRGFKQFIGPRMKGEVPAEAEK